MVETKELAVPCPYMVFKTDGYHECAILREQKNSKVGPLCAWFFDLFNPTRYFQIVENKKTGKPSIISEFNFPDIPHEKEMTEADVPKICPKGYTDKEINAKIQPFMDKVDWEKVRNGRFP